MIRLKYVLIALTVFSACSSPRTPSNLNSDKDTVSQVTVTSSITTDSVDTLCYIDYILKFEDNNSFYTDLYFLTIPNHDDFEKIENMGDSVIYKDDETKRTRIPIEKAGQYFNLTGLNWINVFNKDNQIITTGKLSHIEYIEDMIESKFIAVFKVDNPSISDFQYCISGPMKNFTPKRYISITNPELTSTLIDYLDLKPDDYMIVNHYQLIEPGTTYSTVSADTTAYIIESSGDKINILYKSKSSETIMGLVIISKEINGRPILLTDCGLPDSDMTWTSLLIFNGTEYEIFGDHRIKKE
jgi:hypothetical protein